MRHVKDQLHLWLSGELTDDETALIDAHLAACPECAAAAERERELWRNLGDVTAASDTGTTSVWSAVRARTVGRSDSTPLLGRRPVFGMSLAAGAVAAGLVLSLLMPTDAEKATAPTNGTGDGIWLSDGSWLSGYDTDGMELVWLSPGSAETKDES